MIDKHKFGEAVRAWRLKKKMKQYQLAELLEVSQGSICDIEHGHTLPSCDTVANFVRSTKFKILKEFKRCQVG